MLRISLSSLFLLAFISVFPAMRPQGEAEPDLPLEKLKRMEWLAGTWSGEAWGGRFEAHYSTPAGGRILGHSRLYRDEKEVFYEFEVFEVRGDGVVMSPFPGGNRATGLGLAAHDPKARRAVFENREKDYPTRIVYERVTDDELVITLSDPHGGSEKVETFELER